jgi:hypothetical protein
MRGVPFFPHERSNIQGDLPPLALRAASARERAGEMGILRAWLSPVTEARAQQRLSIARAQGVAAGGAPSACFGSEVDFFK